MDNELKEMLEGFKTDILVEIRQLSDKVDGMDKRLEIVEYKVDRTSERLDDLDLRLRILEKNIRKDIRVLSDDVETVIEVLKQRDILPR